MISYHIFLFINFIVSTFCYVNLVNLKSVIYINNKNISPYEMIKDNSLINVYKYYNVNKNTSIYPLSNNTINDILNSDYDEMYISYKFNTVIVTKNKKTLVYNKYAYYINFIQINNILNNYIINVSLRLKNVINITFENKKNDI